MDNCQPDCLAPDFFDWRSGMFEFPIDAETLKQELSRIFPAGDYEKYTTLTAEERNKEIITIQELIAEHHQTVSLKSKLLFNLGNLLLIEQDYKGAFYAYNEAIKIQSTFYEAWHNRGTVLFLIFIINIFQKKTLNFVKKLLATGASQFGENIK
ncbi:hypothetical protein [uncultured Nostoc sp.]|uniref:hypothetical protein n=1 Tax=uncultured Nostoc sp. TaxID=340711 RepID=UPI00261D7704|nr:hypothetical protein [uncultured Nostoc sp.]